MLNKDKTTLIKYPEGRTNTEYIIPDTVNLIVDGAFYNCEALTSITIPDSVTSIGNSAFNCCPSLTSITIPDSVTSIGAYAFKSCTSLTSITISESVTSISDHAFFACSALTSINVDPLNEYYSSQDGILFNKDKTTLIQYPSGKTNTKYTVPDSVNSISAYAFADCSTLTNITIPGSVNYFSHGVFNCCPSLKSLTILNPDCYLPSYSYTICNGYSDETDEYYFAGTICGYSDSTAQTHADLYGYTFKAIDNIGDVNLDGAIDALDASLVLTEYSALATGQESTLDDIANSNADVNLDGAIDALDASYILSYYAHTATGGTGSILEFI